MGIHKYQLDAHNWAINRLFVEDEKGVALFIDPGLGKTLIALKIFETLRTFGEAKKCLVIAPLRVAHLVWPEEIKKWGFDMKVSIIHGKQKEMALREPADVYITNPETLKFLSPLPTDGVPYPALPKFDLLICDESTMFKTWSCKRSRRLRQLLRRIPKRIIQTGTPATEGSKDLHSQCFILDNGKALGRTVTAFRREYMCRGGYMGRQWEVLADRVEAIEKAISPMVYRLDAKDHLELPEVITHAIKIELPPRIKKAYRKLERELFWALDRGEDLTADCAGQKYAMCRGVANGGLYIYDEDTGDRDEMHVHNAKVDAIAELVDELNGKPLLVAYTFNHDLSRLQAKFPNAPVIRGGVNVKDTARIITEWKAGKHQVVLCQPKAMSHGIDGLQHGGRDIAFFGLPDSLDTYKQTIARLHRTGGNMKGVRVHCILAKNTLDELIYERLQNKDRTQVKLLDALNEYRKKNHHATTPLSTSVACMA